jgi:hypothetical protein
VFSSPAVGPRFAGPFMQCRFIVRASKQASTYQWSTRGKECPNSKNHYRNASFTAITILKSVKVKVRMLNVKALSGATSDTVVFAFNAQYCMHSSQVWLLSCSGRWENMQETTHHPILKTPSCMLSCSACTQLHRQVPRTPV